MTAPSTLDHLRGEATRCRRIADAARNRFRKTSDPDDADAVRLAEIEAGLWQGRLREAEAAGAT